jgi:hypothetical protein
MDVLPSTGEDGADTRGDDWAALLLSELSCRQEAVWAVVSQGRVVVRTATADHADPPFSEEVFVHCNIYVPSRFRDWWSDNNRDCWSVLNDSAAAAWGLKNPGAYLTIEFIIDVPAELVDFVAQNTGRPKPRRYNSTAVQYYERDGVAWLTMPEAKLYDALRETDWLFIPQPQLLASGTIDSRPDFLIFWKHRAQFGVLVEIDSDRFHAAPSVREKDEVKERQFESRGFQYLRFSAKEVLKDPYAVLKHITEYCTGKWGT